MKFKINQIVKGKVAGCFVVLGFRTIGEDKYAQLKIVDPSDYSKTVPGELALPTNSLENI